MTYYVTLEVQTKKPLTQDQQDKLRDALLAAIDQGRIPYGADTVTAYVSETA